MGWSRGSQIAEQIWQLFRCYVPFDRRKELAQKLYDLFCDEDADDWDGSSQLEMDADA